MSKKVNNFKIGLFVIVGTAIGVGGLMLFGGRAMFEKGLAAETYFDGSVQGLDIGSPLKLRGVQIGKVTGITFVPDVYPVTDEQFRRMVVIQMEVKDPAIRERAGHAFREAIEKEVGVGLRVRMQSAGITGLTFLQCDYLEADRYPALDVPWTPKTPYIPSAPNQIAEIAQSIDSIARDLSATDISGIGDSIDKLLETFNNTLNEAEIRRITDGLEGVIAELKDSNDSLQAFLENPEVAEIRSEAKELLAQGRETLKTLEESVGDLTKEGTETLRATRASVEEIGEYVTDEQTRDTLQNLAELTKALPDLIEQMDRSLAALEIAATSKSNDVDVLTQNLAQATGNLRELTTLLRRYPSLAAFGNPPKPIKDSP